jgi:ribosomal protein L12E/L44/L45/RPP1/RPP2
MKKLSIGLLAAVAVALAAAPADAATKKKKSGKKEKAKTEEVAKVPEAHPMAFTCVLNAWTGSKQPKACGG